MVVSTKILSALADPSRLRILKELVRCPAGVLELAGRLELPQPSVSRHLKALREAGIVEEHRSGATRQQRIVENYRREGQEECLDFGVFLIHFDQLPDLARRVRGGRRR